jgi:hypothetical protein
MGSMLCVQYLRRRKGLAGTVREFKQRFSSVCSSDDSSSDDSDDSGGDAHRVSELKSEADRVIDVFKAGVLVLVCHVTRHSSLVCVCNMYECSVV